MKRRLLGVIGLPVAFGFYACTDATGPEAESVPRAAPDVTAFVTGAALESLDSQGHFRFPIAQPPGAYRMVSAEDAVRIALGVIRTWYANPDALTIPGTTGLVESAEDQHGGRVDWSRLKPGPAGAYFAESNVAPAPSELGNPAIRYLAPHFLVPLFEGAVPAVVVAVSAYATNVVLAADGFVLRTDNLDGGNEFRVTGIPLELDGVAMPPSPEVAVQFAFHEAEVEIAEVPVLGVPGNRVVQTAARWKLQLAEPREFERIGDGSLVSTATVYVAAWPSIADHPPGGGSDLSARLRLFVAASEQPETERFGDTWLPIRAGYAVNLNEVRLHK